MADPAVFERVEVPRTRDDRGSLIVVLCVLLVLLLLSSAVAFQVAGNQGNVLAKSRSAASVAAANAGLADALFRLDQTSPASASTFCVTVSGSGPCSQSSGPLSGVSYVATPSAGGTVWTLQSKASVNNITDAVQEIVTYGAKFPFALFGNSGLDFNGQNPGGLGLYNEGKSGASNPDTSATDCTNGVGSSCVKVGSNGPIKCAGGLAGNVSEVYYTGGGGASQCSNPIPDPSKFVLDVPTAPTTGTPLTCPGTATTVNGITVYQLGSAFGTGTIGNDGRTDTYYCRNAALQISGTLAVRGTVLLYDILDATTNNTLITDKMQTLYIAGGSEVNTTFDGTTGPPPAGTTLPNADSLQIFTNSTGTVGSANGGGASGPYTLGGVLYAPDANLVGNGCKSSYWGSLTINTLTCNGGPHLQVYYDNSLGTVYGPPQISGYAQINPRQVSWP